MLLVQATDQNNNDCKSTGKIETLENAIQCMQQQMNGLEIMTMKNAEGNNKIDKQVHILSSMFIKFNNKIINQLLDFNK